MVPLAERMRPDDLSGFFGQNHIIGEGRMLKRLIESGNIPNMVFYGPPGTGKTTLANIIAKKSRKRFYKLNATNASIKDIKDIIEDTRTLMESGGVLLYLDEIQNFDKKRQQSLLEFIENGTITLIASTADNPYFCIYNAILSRSLVFEFKPLSKEDILSGLKKAITILKEECPDLTCEDGALKHIAEVSGGDLRRAMNYLEAAYLSCDDKHITEEWAWKCLESSIPNYDRNGDSHYDALSYLQKSIRGSDPDAAVLALAMLIRGGDLLSICRRLLVIACEDIGLAAPQCISIVKSCVDSALQIGFPEAKIPLSHAVIYLATAPKSNSAICAIESALSDLDNREIGEIPAYLRDGHYEGAKQLGRMQGYKYPHDYPNNYVKQQYMPDKLKDRKYYVPGKNRMEQAAADYWANIKGKTEKKDN